MSCCRVWALVLMCQFWVFGPLLTNLADAAPKRRSAWQLCLKSDDNNVIIEKCTEYLDKTKKTKDSSEKIRSTQKNGSVRKNS